MNITSTKTFAVIRTSIALLATAIATPVIIFSGVSVLEARTSLSIDTVLTILLLFVVFLWGLALNLLFPNLFTTISSWLDQQAITQNPQKATQLLLATALLILLSYLILPIIDVNIAESLERLSKVASQN
jgi:uncharacterized membrane protein YidH (DUF202 family)